MSNVLLPVLNRSCGDCNACCIVFDINELDKAAHTPCMHLTGNCGIYRSRPNICKDYECVWLQGALTENQRPDMLGVIFDVTLVGKDIVLQATEFRDGAMVSDEYSTIITALIARYPSVHRVDVHPLGEKAFGFILKGV